MNPAKCKVKGFDKANTEAAEIAFAWLARAKHILRGRNEARFLYSSRCGPRSSGTGSCAVSRRRSNALSVLSARRLSLRRSEIVYGLRLYQSYTTGKLARLPPDRGALLHLLTERGVVVRMTFSDAFNKIHANSVM